MFYLASRVPPIRTSEHSPSYIKRATKSEHATNQGRLDLKVVAAPVVVVAFAFVVGPTEADGSITVALAFIVPLFLLVVTWLVETTTCLGVG
jgi:hypothetical protein